MYVWPRLSAAMGRGRPEAHGGVLEGSTAARGGEAAGDGAMGARTAPCRVANDSGSQGSERILKAAIGCAGLEGLVAGVGVAPAVAAGT